MSAPATRRRRIAIVGAIGASAALLLPTAHAINATYAKQLERSGCTQVSEAEGCDLHKTREENARAGFAVTPAPAAASAPAVTSTSASPAKTPYAGQWVAKSAEGATVATLRIDAKERVWVDGQRVQARRSDGALVFRAGTRLYTIQGDRRLKGEDVWRDVQAGTQGPIVTE